MSYVIRMPKLGVEMETGIVLQWKVAIDETVAADDVVAEIESEKTSAEVTAREEGVLRRIYLEAGDEAPPGAAMGILAGPDEDISGLEAEAESQAPTRGTSEERNTTEAGRETAVNEPSAGSSGTDERSVEGATAPTTRDGRIEATPKARKRAESDGVALADVAGTGPEGCIVAADVEAAATGTEVERTVREERPLRGMRSTIAERLRHSYRDAPHVTVDRELDIEAAMRAVERVDDGIDGDVTITDVLLAAVSDALTDHPSFNATFDADQDVHRLHHEHNIGIAVDVDGGLLTPVLPDIREMSPASIATERRRLIDSVRDDEYTPDDLSGSTFTVSNLGVVGADSFTPIINPPEVAILGVGRVRERAVRAASGISFRRHATVSLSFDHRVVDGADATRFLVTLESSLPDTDSIPGRDN